MARRPGGATDPKTKLPMIGSRIHLMGVAGAGMRGLALLLAESGYEVSGCDQADASLPELKARGIPLASGHHPDHVAEVDWVVYSAAIQEDAEELSAAKAAGVPVLKRARAVGAWLRPHRVVGVAGTHGKTTITAMAGLVCQAAGLDPTVLVGGRVAEWKAFARPGRGDVAVVEADEYDRSFLELNPALALVSSVEPEHLECYGSWQALKEAYRQFASRAASREGVLHCADDTGAAEVCAPLGGRSYGFSPEADYRVTVQGTDEEGQQCRLVTPAGGWDFRLGCHGEHNAQNAAGALAAALEIGAEVSRAVGGLSTFRGAERRLQVLAEDAGVVVVDDYAHHPTEVRTSLRALRARYPEDRLVAVFQPHLFSRTQEFAVDFTDALAGADLALVLPIYGAREAPIPGVSSALIAEAGTRVRLASREEVVERVRERVRWGHTDSGGMRTVWVFMGAGDVTATAHEAASEVTSRAVGA